jgi:ABC-type dipeptide/oligopeptide/nickel transport system permease subunit
MTDPTSTGPDLERSEPLIDPDPNLEGAFTGPLTDTAGDQSTSAGAVILIGVEEDMGVRRTFWSDAWRILRRRVLFWVALTLIVLFALMAIWPELFTALSPANPDPSGENCFLADARQSPSSEHWFGTDKQGCDYYVQVIHGAKVSMRVALGATVVTVVIGLLLGGISGFYGGWVDNVLTRVADGFFALPYLVGAIIILSALAGTAQRTEWHVLVAIAFLGWPAILRLFRSTVLQVKSLEYVQAARAMGARNRRILFRHISPNAIAPTLVYATVSMGAVISVEATLSFLGIGLPLGTISWGIMLSTAQQSAIAGRDLHLMIFPSIFLILASLAFVLMGEQMREAFDPRLR